MIMVRKTNPLYKAREGSLYGISYARGSVQIHRDEMLDRRWLELTVKAIVLLFAEWKPTIIKNRDTNNGTFEVLHEEVS